MNEVTIQVGLPERSRRAAAELFYQSFRQKGQFFLGAPPAGVVILEHDLCAKQAVVARQADRLVGVAGIQHQRRPFLALRLRTYLATLGLIEGVLRFGAACLAARPYRDGELLMDGIAVDEAVRGQGVGSKLLHAVIDFAQANGYRTVRLDVVDTNVRARQLYERLGFVATRTQRLPIKREWLGFTASTTMIKTLS